MLKKMTMTSHVNCSAASLVLAAMIFGLWSFPQNVFAASGEGVSVTLTATRANPGTGMIDPDYQTIKINQIAIFNFFGEYNGKPETTAETKPGEPEWQFDTVTCSPDETEVTRTIPSPVSWTPSLTIFGSDYVQSSKEGQWSLTYTASVRFPKLNTSDGTPVRDDDGNRLYFGPYSASVTVRLKVTTIPFKAWIVSIDDNFPGHSFYKLGLLESGEIQIANLDSNDPPVSFSKAELKEGEFATLENRNVTAKKSAGSVTINVWAKDDNTGTEYGPEELTVTVVKPDDINIVRAKNRQYKGKKTKKDTADIGFIGVFYLTPNDVSFSKLKAYEGVGGEADDDGKVSASGYFQRAIDVLRKECQRLWESIKIHQLRIAMGLPENKKKESEQIIKDCQDQLRQIQNDSSSRIDPEKFCWHGGKELVSDVLLGIPEKSGKPNTLVIYDKIANGPYNKGEFEYPTSPGFADGIRSWNIAYSYIVGEGTEPVKNFARKITTFIITREGTMSAQKGNGLASAAYEDGDFDYSDGQP